MTELVDRTVLTARESQVMDYVCEGARDGEIARELGVSIETIKSHMRRIFRVLGARNRTNAAHLYTLRREST